MVGKLLHNVLKRQGYSVQWLPQVMVDDEAARVPISLEFFVGHLMLFKPRPVFVEIGANDGVSNDPIFPFVERFGWTGIMVEPLPAPFARLQGNYGRFTQVHLVNAAIGDTDGERTLYKIKEYEGQYANASQFASFNRDLVASQTAYVPNAANEIEEIQVPCLTIETLLSRYPVDPIDLVVIDAEGYDGEIIRMFDFGKMRPAIIQFEHAAMGKQERQSIARLLVNYEYRLFSDHLDTIAYRAPAYLGWAEHSRIKSLS
jgi:FkbM family methyltransferase